MFSHGVNKSQKGTRHVAGRDAEIMGHEREKSVSRTTTIEPYESIYKPLITDVSDRGNC